MKRLLTVASILALASTGIAAQSATGTGTFRACVKKATGEMRMMGADMKKCKKGWRKLSWTKAGPVGEAGAPGAQGPAGNAAYLGFVIDGSGAVVGRTLGSTIILSPLMVVQVLVDGGSYAYLTNGQLLPLGSPSYQDPACAGAPFVPADDLRDVDLWGASPLARVVYRPTVPGLGPTRAFKLTGTTGSIVNSPTYFFSSTGECVLDDPVYTGYRIELTEVAAPPDRIGPLRLI